MPSLKPRGIEPSTPTAKLCLSKPEIAHCHCLIIQQVCNRTFFSPSIKCVLIHNEFFSSFLRLKTNNLPNDFHSTSYQGLRQGPLFQGRHCPDAHQPSHQQEPSDDQGGSGVCWGTVGIILQRTLVVLCTGLHSAAPVSQDPLKKPSSTLTETNTNLSLNPSLFQDFRKLGF